VITQVIRHLGEQRGSLRNEFLGMLELLPMDGADAVGTVANGGARFG
jgi:hypothetical protein